MKNHMTASNPSMKFYSGQSLGPPGSPGPPGPIVSLQGAIHRQPMTNIVRTLRAYEQKKNRQGKKHETIFSPFSSNFRRLERLISLRATAVAVKKPFCPWLTKLGR